MRLKKGDIFTIPIDEGKLGFGQIVYIPNKSNFIIVVFDRTSDEDNLPTIESIANSLIIFFGYTLDALLYHKQWKIIGNDISTLAMLKWPFYKLGTPPDCRLVNYKGNYIGRITKAKFDQLSYQDVIAPIRYENALKAYYKLTDWQEHYDVLRYENVEKSISIIEGQLPSINYPGSTKGLQIIDRIKRLFFIK